MGKTKTKTIDDSVKEEPKVPNEPKAPVEIAGRGVAGEGDPRRATAGSETTEDVGRGQSPTGPRAKAKVSKRAAKKTVQGGTTHGKKYQEAREKVERNKKYPLVEAIALASETSYSKFSGSLEAHINTAAKNMRGLVSLPYISGKKLRVLAFGKDADKSGADIVGSDEILADIEKGKINFDVVITTPEWMPKLSKAARILGPRGLMPNPKSGTITENLAKAVTEITGGKTEYKTEPNGQVIHLLVGKAGQAPEEVSANIKALYNTVGKSRVKKITLSATMGPGIKVDLSSI